MVLTVWFSLAFFTPFQAQMFSSERFIKPLICRSQQPLGKNQTEANQINKSLHIQTLGTRVYCQAFACFTALESKNSHTIRKYLAVFLAMSYSISRGSHSLSVQKFAFLFNLQKAVIPELLSYRGLSFPTLLLTATWLLEIL